MTSIRVALVLLGASALGATEFPGWRDLVVLPEADWPTMIRSADCDGDGRDEILLVNRRQSRIDIVDWLPAEERAAGAGVDPDAPNELGMHPAFKHRELPLQDLPIDVLPSPVHEGELLVVVGSPNRILRMRRGAAGEGWEQSGEWNLLPGELSGYPSLLRDAPDGPELLVSTGQGLQYRALRDDARPAWLHPRGATVRRGWALGDLDGDGDDDLLEAVQGAHPLRWYRADGELRPAQALNLRELRSAAVLRRGEGADEVMVLDPRGNLLRRYRLAQGEAGRFGDRAALQLPGDGSRWCGVSVGDEAALAVVDPKQPRMLIHRLGEDGWDGGTTYPCVDQVSALHAAPGHSGILLLWVEDAAELFRSECQDQRFSFPQPWSPDAGEGERLILGMGDAPGWLWWLQASGDDLLLHRWSAGADEPELRRFTGARGKVAKGLWLGGDRILVQDAYQRGARLLRLVDGAVIASEPSHLKKGVDLDAFRLLPDGAGGLRPALLHEGVLQWLGGDLLPIDQVMLGEGQALSDFAIFGDGSNWALEKGGEQLHLMQGDDGGVLRPVASETVPGGNGVIVDDVLGPVLVGSEQIVRLGPGQPWSLQLIETIDARDLRPADHGDAAIHRIMRVDVDGDGDDELIATDDVRHRLALLQRGAEGLAVAAVWPVFEDKRYPYGGGSGNEAVAEPRQIAAGDIDGDGKRDLFLLCHDRLICYLGGEAVSEEDPQ